MIHEVLSRDDFQRCFSLFSDLLKDEGLPPIPFDVSYANFEKAQSFGYRQLYATNGNIVTGVLGLRPFYDPLEVHPGFEINNFIVAPAFRSGAVALALIRHAEKLIRESGGAWIRGMVMLSKPQVKKVYARFGYEHTHDHVYKDL